jgi:hypothetical protein
MVVVMKDYRHVSSPQQVKHPSAIETFSLTDRDKKILQSIQAFEGFLSLQQIRDLYFPCTSGGREAALRRCRRLRQAGYLIEATKQERKLIPTKIYWLGKRGYKLCAAGHAQGAFRWRKKPRLDRVAHDLSVNDFHLDILQAAPLLKFELVEWCPGYTFETHPDTVSFTNSRQKLTRRRIEPDSFFTLRSGEHFYRFGLEVELAPKDTNRLMNDKILPLLAWIKSDVYKRRFGYNSGGFLFTFSDQTTGLMRLLIGRLGETLKQEGRYFHFARMRDINTNTILAAPIWHKSTTREPLSLAAACNR